MLRLHEPYTHVASIYDSSPPLLRRAKYPFARLPHQESFQSIPFYPPKLSADSKKYPIFALHWFASFPHKRKLRLKGNRVQIPDSPAAVSFTKNVASKLPHATGALFPGRPFATETSQKTCHANSISLLSRKKR